MRPDKFDSGKGSVGGIPPDCLGAMGGATFEYAAISGTYRGERVSDLLLERGLLLLALGFCVHSKEP